MITPHVMGANGRYYSRLCAPLVYNPHQVSAISALRGLTVRYYSHASVSAIFALWGLTVRYDARLSYTILTAWRHRENN